MQDDSVGEDALYLASLEGHTMLLSCMQEVRKQVSA